MTIFGHTLRPDRSPRTSPTRISSAGWQNVAPPPPLPPRTGAVSPNLASAQGRRLPPLPPPGPPPPPKPDPRRRLPPPIPTAAPISPARTPPPVPPPPLPRRASPAPPSLQVPTLPERTSSVAAGFQAPMLPERTSSSAASFPVPMPTLQTLPQSTGPTVLESVGPLPTPPNFGPPLPPRSPALTPTPSAPAPSHSTPPISVSPPAIQAQPAVSDPQTVPHSWDAVDDPNADEPPPPPYSETAASGEQVLDELHSPITQQSPVTPSSQSPQTASPAVSVSPASPFGAVYEAIGASTGSPRHSGESERRVGSLNASNVGAGHWSNSLPPIEHRQR